MKNKIIKFIFLVSLFFSIQSFANTINKIDFVGLDIIPSSSLINLLPVKVGDQYNEQISNNIIEVLFKTGYFSDIKIDVDNNNLIITLIENPVIKYFDVKTGSGSAWSDWLNSDSDFLNEEKINEYLESNELSVGNIYTQSKFSDFVTSLKDEYIAGGFYGVQIDSNIDIDMKNRIGIELNVNQGKRARITSMTISGANKFSEDELLKLFLIGEADMMLINYFTKKDRYSDLALNQSLELMTNHYFNSGYLDFKILNVNSTLNDSKDQLSIDIQVSEGIQYKLGNVSFEGELGNQTAEKLSDLLTIKNGDIFNRQSVIDDIQTIVDIYSDQGYAFVDINPIIEDFLDTVNVKINISLNKKVYINRITISGNTRTQDEVIRREIGISEGSAAILLMQSRNA